MDLLSASRQRLLAGEGIVAGCLSGTSADGIDVALVRPTRVREPEDWERAPQAPVCLAFETLAFESDLASRVRAVLDGRALGLGELAYLSRDLGRAFGAAARKLAASQGLALDLVASHGQTVWHHDGNAGSGPASLQLGGGNFVAQAAETLCVADFRQADMACGGGGAPISALVDDLLFASHERPLAILNLGGMATLTLLGQRGSTELSAFDTGPAGSLLDGLARRLLGQPFDDYGRVAARGQVHAGWVREILSHTFYTQTPPKSTGRDTFGEAWIERLLASPLGREVQARGTPDVLASAACAVAQSVLEGLTRFGPKGLKGLVLAGGGAKNLRLVRSLSEASGAPVYSSRELGVNPDAREALVFAILGLRCLFGLSSTNPGATGARRGGILGAIFQPAREF
jgi:anhydro-N-acetylmuramic acid kinase